MEYIEREAFLAEQRHLYCENCARRKNGKGKFVYEIGDTPCRACDIGDVLDAVEDFPAADVRPVVTCGKCKFGKYTGTEWFCDKHSGHADKFGEDASYHEYHSKHWFCADGEERKHE